MKRHAPLLLVLLIAAILAFCATGCSTTYPMKIAMCRAATDITVTGLIDNKVLGSDDVLLIVHRLRDALEELDTVPKYTAEVYAAVAPYTGGKILGRLLLKTIPKYAYKLGTYNYGLSQVLNQAELAANEWVNATGGSP